MTNHDADPQRSSFHQTIAVIVDDFGHNEGKYALMGHRQGDGHSLVEENLHQFQQFGPQYR